MLPKDTVQELTGDINNSIFVLNSIKQQLNKNGKVTKIDLTKIHQDLSFEIPALESILTIIESCLEEGE